VFVSLTFASCSFVWLYNLYIVQYPRALWNYSGCYWESMQPLFALVSDSLHRKWRNCFALIICQSDTMLMLRGKNLLLRKKDTQRCIINLNQLEIFRFVFKFGDEQVTKNHLYLQIKSLKWRKFLTYIEVSYQTKSFACEKFQWLNFNPRRTGRVDWRTFDMCLWISLKW